MKNIVSFSGGKDSTAMLLKMIENKINIDGIVFAKVMATPTINGEFEAMYEYISKVEDYIKRDITIFSPIQRRNRQGTRRLAAYISVKIYYQEQLCLT